MNPDRPAARARTQARRVYALRALLTPQERHEFKVLAAQRGISTQDLAGEAVRELIKRRN